MKHYTHIAFVLCVACSLSGTSYKRQLKRADQAFSQRDYHKAIELYRRVLTKQQDLPNVYLNLARAYQEVGNLKQAEHMYAQAIQYNPQLPQALFALAKIYAEDNKFDQAIALYKKAAALASNDITHLIDFANTLNMNHQTEEALTWLEKLEKLAPHNTSVLNNIGYTLNRLNRIDEALSYYQRALEIQPNHPDVNFNYAHSLLTTGNKSSENWEKGLAAYEWRWRKLNNSPLRHYNQPLWTGDDIRGKTVLIWSEQGLGDTFQFIRYAYVVKAMGAHKVIAAVQNSLYDIIQLCPYIDTVIRQQDTPPPFDTHIPLLSMPHRTKTRLDTVPNEIPYLFAEPHLISSWKEKLSRDQNFKIGICWQGNPNYANQFIRTAVATKSMSISQFLPLANIPNVSIYSLQQITGTDQINELPGKLPIIIFEGDFDASNGRFMDTAAVIKNLDLVITIDTSICHLAAGLGTPTWNLLPHSPDWRWFLACDNSPWYPNMRLFRQKTPGDWAGVLKEVHRALIECLHNGAPLITSTHPYNATT